MWVIDRTNWPRPAACASADGESIGRAGASVVPVDTGAARRAHCAGCVFGELDRGGGVRIATVSADDNPFTGIQIGVRQRFAFWGHTIMPCLSV